jgi:hypothetical protein
VLMVAFICSSGRESDELAKMIILSCTEFEVQ